MISENDHLMTLIDLARLLTDAAGKISVASGWVQEDDFPSRYRVLATELEAGTWAMEKFWQPFLSYGEVACMRQGEIIRELTNPQKNISTDADEIAEALFKRLNNVGGIHS